MMTKEELYALQNKLVPKAPKPIELFFKERVK